MVRFWHRGVAVRATRQLATTPPDFEEEGPKPYFLAAGQMGLPLQIACKEMCVCVFDLLRRVQEASYI